MMYCVINLISPY